MTPQRAGELTRLVWPDYLDLMGPIGPAKTCQYMSDGPVCGEKSLLGKSYCKSHYAICYTTPLAPSKRRTMAFSMSKALL